MLSSNRKVKEKSPKQLSRIKLDGFKSIEFCELELGNLNVIIGCNGSGKSNFISFFKMIQQILDQKLQIYVTQHGGPDSLLHYGRRCTPSLSYEIEFGKNVYSAALNPTLDNRMMFIREKFMAATRFQESSGHTESRFLTFSNLASGIWAGFKAMLNWRVYHFHDTGESSLIKQQHGINANDFLRHDARNLAAFLYFLKEKHNDSYKKIVDTVKLVAPFFEDFCLRPNPGNENMIELEWKHTEEDMPFKAFMLSDGTLRFICLATVLLQPAAYQPETIVIDEPELGLHPTAINILASLMRSASKNRQLLIATQSTELLTHLEDARIFVAELKQRATVFRQLEGDELKKWLENYNEGSLAQ